MDNLRPVLRKSSTARGAVQELGSNAWRLEIPLGPAGRYRLAQLDDYHGLARRAFLWSPPLRMTLTARACAAVIPGTWGFGLWNDPFGMGILGGGDLVRLPVPPNVAWFFFASPPNHLSLRDDLPAQGALAMVFRSPLWPAAFSLLGALALPLLALPPVVRIFRRLARQVVRQDTVSLPIDPTDWHHYKVEWYEGDVRFWVNGETVLQTSISPHGRLGLVLWVDNQYAAVPPFGRLRYGTLPNPQPAWIEIRDLVVEQF